MRRIRITVMRKACHRDLIEMYENPIEHAISDRMPTTTYGRMAMICTQSWGASMLEITNTK